VELQIAHDRLLSHVTFTTKVGVSFMDHINNGKLEIDSFSCECYQVLCSPPFFLGGENIGTEARGCHANLLA